MKHNHTWLLTAAAVAWMLIVTSAAATAGEPQHEMKIGKKGDVTFTTETRVGNLTLEPGRYFFRHRVEGNDHFVQFTEVTKRSPVTAISGGAPMSQPEEVKCKVEPLSKKAEATTLFFDDKGGVHRLTKAEIAGENVAHLFSN